MTSKQTIILLRTCSACVIIPTPTCQAFEEIAMEDWRARWPIPYLRALWSVVRPPLVRYREIAPAAGLIYAIWQRRQWQKQTELQALAVREGRFMEQCFASAMSLENQLLPRKFCGFELHHFVAILLPRCSILLVNLEGLTCGANLSSTVSIQTLFTRTLRSLMFDNETFLHAAVS